MIYGEMKKLQNLILVHLMQWFREKEKNGYQVKKLFRLRLSILIEILQLLFR